MSPLIRNGWEIYFHRRLFGQQRSCLRERVRQLKANLPEEEFLAHPTTKLLAAVMCGIKEKITLDPFASLTAFPAAGELDLYASGCGGNSIAVCECLRSSKLKAIDGTVLLKLLAKLSMVSWEQSQICW